MYYFEIPIFGCCLNLLIVDIYTYFFSYLQGKWFLLFYFMIVDRYELKN